MAKHAPVGQSEAIYAKTLKEVAASAMAGPFSEQQLETDTGHTSILFHPLVSPKE